MMMARTYPHNADLGAFMRVSATSSTREMRWLKPVAGRWEATCEPERRISAETYALLRDGKPSQLIPNAFDVGTSTYILVDNGFETVAELT